VNSNPAETDRLLAAARRGDAAARDALFARHRDLVRRAVALRLDRRVGARVDVSDVVQDACAEAARRLPAYLAADAPMPFGLWLRWIARERVAVAHRAHLAADCRAAGREVPALPAESSAAFAAGLLGREPSPSRAAGAAEAAELLRAALGRLDEDERDLILWRHFEQLTNREAAAILGVTEAAAAKRYVRALERLCGFLTEFGVRE
jgi:RNA polymerase sigma-70 factor (ECF subfamily)